MNTATKQSYILYVSYIDFTGQHVSQKEYYSTWDSAYSKLEYLKEIHENVNGNIQKQYLRGDATLQLMKGGK